MLEQVAAAAIGAQIYDPFNRSTHNEFDLFIRNSYGDGSDAIRRAAADAVEMGYRDPLNFLNDGEVFGPHEEQLILEGVGRVIDYANDHAQKLIDRLPEGMPNAQKPLALGCMLATEVHGPQLRQSGRSYLNHPIEAAAIGLEVFRRLQAIGWQIDSEYIEQTLLGTLIHDVPEETVRSRDISDPNRPPSYRPLLIRQALRLLGVPYAERLSRTVRYLTRAEGGLSDVARAWLPTYSEHREISQVDPGFCAVKLLDTSQNIGEPKPTPTPAAAASWACTLEGYGRSVDAIQETIRKKVAAGTPGWPPHMVPYAREVRLIEAKLMPNLVPGLLSHIYPSGGMPHELTRLLKAPIG